ncbi:hypothetical protein [Helicobacter marmotae]|nr:hypothetical protein [Helicobacter marmotae]
MKAYMSAYDIRAILKAEIAPYIHNPYVLVGFGNGGFWEGISLCGTKAALARALALLANHKRLQKLILIAPCEDILESLEDIAFLCACGVSIDIYIGSKDNHAQAIIESLRPFAVLRYYKDVAFMDKSAF